MILSLSFKTLLKCKQHKETCHDTIWKTISPVPSSQTAYFLYPALTSAESILPSMSSLLYLLFVSSSPSIYTLTHSLMLKLYQDRRVLFYFFLLLHRVLEGSSLHVNAQDKMLVVWVGVMVVCRTMSYVFPYFAFLNFLTLYNYEC
jgi:hypothetical protein